MSESIEPTVKPPKPLTLKDLSVRHRKFVQHYLRTGNGSASAISAGYSKDSARFYASELLTFPNIKAVIANICEANTVSTEFLMARLSDQASASLGELVDHEGKIKPAAFKERSHLVKKLKHGKEGTEIELHSPQAATEMILRVRGRFLDKVEHSGATAQPIALTINLNTDEIDATAPPKAKES